MLEKIKKILLDHTLFITSVAVMSAFILGLLIYVQFFATRSTIPIDELMEVKHYREKPTFPLKLHHSGFDVKQIKLIEKAADSWRQKTDGRLDVRLEPWDPPEPFSEIKYENYDKYTMWLLDGDDPEVVKLFIKYSITMGGLCVGHFIGIMKDPDIDDQMFLRASAHEMGHLMALEHIKENYPALMNLKAKDAITEYDMIQVDFQYPR